MTPITSYTCNGGHVFLVSYDVCPTCGESLTVGATEAVARLVSHTVVRVNPTGQPFRLGLAETRCGARTLCIVDRDVLEGDIELYLDGGRYHARACVS